MSRGRNRFTLEHYGCYRRLAGLRTTGRPVARQLDFTVNEHLP